MDPLEQSYLTPLDATWTAQMLSSPPFLQIDGAANFRDVGNLDILTKRSKYKTRSKRVFRSAQLSHLQSGGRDALLHPSLNIRAIFDLRSIYEVKAYHAPVVNNLPGVTVYHVPVVDDGHFCPISVNRREMLYERGDDQGLIDEYKSFLESAGNSFGTIFRWMRDHPDEACLVHCVLGKDRTGLFVALLLMLVGVSDEDICKDYALSRAGLERARTVILSLMTESPPTCAAMMSCRRSTMQAMLSFIRQRYTGAEGYLREKCGLTTDDLHAIKASFLVFNN
ncbi:hypothetical protein FRC20_001195 [Serendipita sp. 405]|nr:hypothetical protein FRC20_001195 [Serendipita sp. 405]